MLFTGVKLHSPFLNINVLVFGAEFLVNLPQYWHWIRHWHIRHYVLQRNLNVHVTPILLILCEHMDTIFCLMKNFFLICTVIHVDWIFVLSHSHITLFTFFCLKVKEESDYLLLYSKWHLKKYCGWDKKCYNIFIRNLTGRDNFGDEV